MRIRFAALDEMGEEVMVEGDACVGENLRIEGLAPAPTMAEYDKVRPVDSATGSAGETRFIRGNHPYGAEPDKRPVGNDK